MHLGAYFKWSDETKKILLFWRFQQKTPRQEFYQIVKKALRKIFVRLVFSRGRRREAQGKKTATFYWYGWKLTHNSGRKLLFHSDQYFSPYTFRFLQFHLFVVAVCLARTDRSGYESSKYGYETYMGTNRLVIACLGVFVKSASPNSKQFIIESSILVFMPLPFFLKHFPGYHLWASSRKRHQCHHSEWSTSLPPGPKIENHVLISLFVITHQPDLRFVKSASPSSTSVLERYLAINIEQYVYGWLLGT